MKTISLNLIATLVGCALLSTSVLMAQSPQKMTYQAIIRNSENQLVANNQIGMRISILKETITGSVIYEESYILTTNANGLVTLEIGGGSGFDTINWANGPFFVKTEIDPTGGNYYTVSGITQLLSVPYAFHANTAEFLTAGETQSLADVLNIGNSANNQRITKLLNPKNDQDAATKAYVDQLLTRIEYIENLLGIENTVEDVDGNIYQTVTIGNQVWMAENLRVTHYANGDPIATGLSNNNWWYSQTPAYAIYPYSSIPGLNSQEEVIAAYGALYNGYAVLDSRGLCPAGWRIPTFDEWGELYEYLGGMNLAGGKLKSERTAPESHPRWDNPNEGATNLFGFNGLPAGLRKFNGQYEWIGSRGDFWTSTLNSETYLLTRGLRNFTEDAWWGYSNFEYGMSVRCIKQ